jgi:hypothetical protein
MDIANIDLMNWVLEHGNQPLFSDQHYPTNGNNNDANLSSINDVTGSH